MDKNTKTKPLVQSVERALDIMELVFMHENPLRSSDIANLLNLNCNTTNNLVRTLYRRAYLSQDENGRYMLGSFCARLGEAADRWSILRETSLPIMKKLTRTTEDGAFLGINDGGKLHCVLTLLPTGNIRVVEKQIWNERLHTTAAGKALLAGMDDCELNGWLAKAKLVSLTPKTLSNSKQLCKDILLSKARGWTKCQDEAADGICALGVPVICNNGKTIAGLAQSFPSYYLESGKVVACKRAEILKTMARKIATAYESRQPLYQKP